MSLVQSYLSRTIIISLWLILYPSSSNGRHVRITESEIRDGDDDDDDDSDENLTLRILLGVGGAFLLIAILLLVCFTCSRFGCLPSNWRWTMGQWGNTIENDDVTNLQPYPSQNTVDAIDGDVPNPTQEQSTDLDGVPSFTEATSCIDNSNPLNEDPPPPSYYDATISSFSPSSQPVVTTPCESQDLVRCS